MSRQAGKIYRFHFFYPVIYITMIDYLIIITIS